MSAAAPAPSAGGPLLSVIVPVLEEEREIVAVLDHLAALPGRWEVIVCDGGSPDATVALARAHPLGPRVLEVSGGGRARQCNAAAARAGGAALLFLHADTRLPPGAHVAVTAALAHPRGYPGGNFALRFDGADRFSRGLGRWYAIQRRAGIYYGDSVLWLRREAFAALGGFRELAIMEDHDLVQRLERLGPTACLPGPAVTSSRRWRALGTARTGLAWTAIRWLYLAGVPAERLARWYRPAR